LIVSSDTFSISTVVPGQISCNTLLIDGVDIDTKIANSTGSSITQADLDTKQNTLTSSSNILTSRIDVSDKLVTTGTSPTLYLKDTDQRSGMIHMNSNRMYFLSGVTNSETWTQINSQWPLYLQTDTNQALFGGNITSPNWIRSTPVYRLTNQFPGGGNLVTIASNISITGSGNFIMHFNCSGNATQSGLNGIFELRFRNNSSGTVTSLIESTFYFNQSGVHQHWSISRYITFFSAGTYSLQLTRNSTALSHDGNDYITVVIDQTPF